MKKKAMPHRLSRELLIFFKEHKERCTQCGRAFEDGMCAHLGYLPNQIPAVLCDDCAPSLMETVVRYYWMNDKYEKPIPTDKLWRYMDLGKFIHLISSRKLYFASADSFEDPFEGAKGIVERKEKWDTYYLDQFRQAIRTIPGATPEKLTPEHIEKNAQRLLTDLNLSGEWQREHTFINCWHNNEFESEAMWKLYSINTQNAVAIQTTAAHLYEALDRNPDVTIGKVKYVDYNERFIPINGAYWYKRKSFEHEREVRAVTTKHDELSKGLAIPIEIDTLIDCVYISPYAPKWFEEVVLSVIEKYGLSVPVRYSEMTKRPFY